MKKNPFQNTAATTHTTNTTKRRRRQPENCRQGWNRIPVFVRVTKNHYSKNENKIREDLIMNKLAKRISAVVLAGAMTLSSSVAAFAADLTVYIRESNGNTKTITKDAFKAFEVENVGATDKLNTVLTRRTLTNGSTLTTTWSNTVYLKDLELTDASGNTIYKGLQDGEYSNLKYDDDMNVIGGTWAGHSWMWAPASLKEVVSYPDKTLAEVTCADVNYAIVLSYEYSSFSW